MVKGLVAPDTNSAQKTLSTIDGKVGVGGKFLTFFIDSEEYGIEISKVQEIVGMMPITSIPRTPKFIRGVINLRGKIIPVVDLRQKFGIEAKADTDETCIIVVQTQDVQAGIVVDRVSEVLYIDSSEIESAPSFGEGVSTDFILGMGICRTDGKVKLLLDIDKVLSTQETPSVNPAASSLKQEKPSCSSSDIIEEAAVIKQSNA